MTEGLGEEGGEVAEFSLSKVFEQYRDRIHRYILRTVRDPAQAEDLTQETFLRVHRKVGTLKEPNALTPWLYRVAFVCARKPTAE